MSALRCEMCSALIDSDKDADCVLPEFWAADGDRHGILCWVCRVLHLERPMTKKPDYERGYKDGLRFAITWLHRRANEEMNDPVARALLNSAATNLGWDKTGDIQNHMIARFGHPAVAES